MLVANLFWKFSFNKVDGEQLDWKTQVFGMTMQPRPYSVIVSPRF